MKTAKTEVSRFFKSHDFKRSLLMTLLMLGVGFSLFYSGNSEHIIGVSIGILLTSFSDLQGSFRHRTLAMLLSVVVNTVILVFINVVAGNLVFLLLALAVVSFLLANLSVYGNRASFFTLSGLLAMVFSLIRIYPFAELVIYSIAFICGGLLYVIISTIYHWVTRKSQTIERLGELTNHTAEYLALRLHASQSGHQTLANDEMLELQTTITEKQEEVRNLILSDRQFGGQSHSRNRNMLLLIELIDIMELAVANPAKFQAVQQDVILADDYLPVFYQIAEQVWQRLSHFTQVILDKKSTQERPNFEQLFREAEKNIQQYVDDIGLPAARPGGIMLLNLLDYLKKQVGNIDAMERLLANVARQRQIDFSTKRHGRFLTKEDYKLDTLLENFDLQAPMFRHSIRIAVAVVLGYAVGKLINVVNAYWILLTIVVIMRPTYGLTKERSQQRVLGTIVGVVLAIGLIQISTNSFYFVAMAAISMLFAFSLIQRNYFIAATAITLNVVFVFTLIDSNHWEVIQYRLVDTLLGASVSLLVSFLIFPNWEHINLNTSLKEVIESNQAYIKGIAQYYANQLDEIDYRLLRKQAFLSTSELNSVFQQFTKEPSAKQKNYSIYYEIITLNQSMLSTLANLGSYIQDHHITEMNEEVTQVATTIAEKLDLVLQNLNGEEYRTVQNNDLIQAEQQMHAKWQKLETIRNQQLKEGFVELDSNLQLQMQEVSMIREELNWLQSLTENLIFSVKQL